MIWLADDGSWGTGEIIFLNSDDLVADAEAQELYQEMLDGVDGTELYDYLVKRSK